MIVVYDITRRETFEHVEYWMGEVRSNSVPDIPVVLIGNKSDQNAQRAVRAEEGQQYAGAVLCPPSCSSSIPIMQPLVTFPLPHTYM